MKQLYTTLLICCGLSTSVFAQQDSSAKASLTLAAIYGNTVNYYGQTTAEKLPYVLSYGAYKLKSGFYISASALKLLNSSDGIASVDLSAGYGFNLAKNLDGSMSYSRSFFQANSPLLQTANENNLNADLTFDHIFKSNLSGNYAFGTQSDAFLSFTNSKLISIGSINKEKDLISIEPGITVSAGTQHFYETYTTEQKKRKKLLDPLFPGQQPEPTTTTVVSTSFDVLAYTFTLPLAYNRSNYTIEASYQASLANKNVVEASNKPVSIFNLSFYYMF